MDAKIDLKIGDVVIVKPGVKDPGLNIDIGGWQGRVSEIDNEDNIVGIDWDSITLNNMPGSNFEKCKELDIDWRQVYLDVTEIALTTPRDTKEDVEETIRMLEIRHGLIDSDEVSETSSGGKGKQFHSRARAYIIDLISIYILTWMASNIFALLIGREFQRVETESQPLNYFVWLAINTLYFTVFEWLYGGTLGKVYLRMRVVNYDGRPCSLWQAFIRALYRFIDGLIFGLIAYLTMKPPLYQRLGDKQAGTIVVSTKDPIVQELRAGWIFFVAIIVFLILTGVIQILLLLTNGRFL